MKKAATKDRERPLGVLGYFFHEALRRLWTYKRTSGLAIGMIAIALLTLGVFLLVAENLNRAVDLWQGRSHLTIYLHKSATMEQTEEVRRYLDSRPSLASYQFVNAEEAGEKFKQHFTELSPVVDDFEESPFPPSFEVQLSRKSIEDGQLNRWAGELALMTGVEDLQFDWQWVSRLKRISSLLSMVGILAGGILAVAAAFTIANVIRLTMLLYREEIDIMRLVGATEKIIRGPFLVEGLMQGVVGGAIAVGSLYGLFHGAKILVEGPSSAFIWEFLFTTFLPWYKCLALVGGGVLAGLLGSWLSFQEWSEEIASA